MPPKRLLRSLLVSMLIGLGVLCASPGRAQTSPAPPDPLHLSADWAAYFEGDAAAVNQRIKALEQQLTATRRALAPEQAGATGPLIDAAQSALHQWLRLKAVPTPTPPPEKPFGERYSLSQLLDLATQARDARSEVAIERRDLGEQEAALKAARGRYDTDKAAYLALEGSDLVKLQSGLTLIRDWLTLRHAEEKLRLERARTDIKSELLRRLDAEVAEASPRLAVTDGDLSAFRKAAAAAAEDAARLSEKGQSMRMQDPALAETPLERAEQRLRGQMLREVLVRQSESQLRLNQANLSLMLVQYLAAETAPRAALETLQNHLAQHRTLLRKVESDLHVWRRAVDQEWAQAGAELSVSEGTDLQLAGIHRAWLQKTADVSVALGRIGDLTARGHLITDICEDQIAKKAGRLTVVWRTVEDAALGTANAVRTWTARSLFTVDDTPITLLGILRVLVILGIAWAVSHLLRRGLQRATAHRHGMSSGSIHTLSRLFHYAVLTIGLLIGLSSIGLDFTKLALVASALGIGLGFGLQAVFGNFVAGLILLVERSLKVGDFVDLQSGITGEVREINIRSTLVTTNDNVDILVPNSEFVNGRVTNWTLREVYRRFHVPFGVAYGSDKETVRAAALEAAESVPYTLKGHQAREPQAWMVGFGESSLNFELVVWVTLEGVKRPAATLAAYCWALETALRRHGIEMPFPQRDIHIKWEDLEAASRSRHC